MTMQFYEKNGKLTVILNRNPMKSKARFALTQKNMLLQEEGLNWLDLGRLKEAKGTFSIDEKTLDRYISDGKASCINTAYQDIDWWKQEEKRIEELSYRKKKVHLLALGDVGSTVLMGLKLLGGESIEEIGIFDLNQNVCRRWEYEMNQTAYPWDYDKLPKVKILKEEELFDCDVFVFCASKGIPPVGSDVKDVRMVQFEANRQIVSRFARLAREHKFKGLFAVVSDPVDPLCKVAFLSSNQNENGEFDKKGLLPEQIQGYGLGVMNARAAYYAKKDIEFSDFLTEGRAFGPHGDDLVIANSIDNYDDERSKKLTQLAVEANLRTREAGFKPYIAPALSSAAISIILTIEGKWHYSSNFLGGVYMGCKNRTTTAGLEIESLNIPEQLYRRLERAFYGLEAIE